MDLVSIRMITDELDQVVEFYERITGVAAVRYTPVFAELIMPSCTLAIGHTQTTQLFGEDSARPADNHTVIIEFRVDDVDSRVRAAQAAGHRVGAEAGHHAVGQPLDAVPRSRRQPRQLLHAGHRGRHQEVRGLTFPVITFLTMARTNRSSIGSRENQRR